MNHWSNSPGIGGGFGQPTNESPSFAARRKGTPQEKGGSSSNSASDCKYLMSMSEDLEKLRRSSHHMRNSSHHLRNSTTAARRPRHNQFEGDAMDDNEHDDIVKGLLYPGLEETDDNDNMDDSDEFGCDDFFEEDLAMAQAAVNASSSSARSTSSSMSDLLNNTSPPMMSSYERSYFATMGRPYSDLTNEKLGR